MVSFNRKFSSSFLIAIAVLIPSRADNPTGKNIECAKELIGWCNNMEYGYIGQSLLTTSYKDDNGKPHYVYCKSDRSGTIILIDQTSWFTCSPDHKATYKGRPLQNSSMEDVDGELCIILDQITTKFLNDWNKGVEKWNEGQKVFYEKMANFQKNLADKLSFLKKPCFPFCSVNGNKNTFQESMTNLQKSLSPLSRKCFPFCRD